MHVMPATIIVIIMYTKIIVLTMFHVKCNQLHKINNCVVLYTSSINSTTIIVSNSYKVLNIKVLITTIT